MRGWAIGSRFRQVRWGVQALANLGRGRKGCRNSEGGVWVVALDLLRKQPMPMVTARVDAVDPGAPWRVMQTYTRMETMLRLGFAYLPAALPTAVGSGTGGEPMSSTGGMGPIKLIAGGVYPAPWIADVGAPATAVCTCAAQAAMGDAIGSVQPVMRPTGLL
jgi:hypothetical protein